MKALYLTLRILYGLLFITSAVLKLFPIEAFELILIQQVGFSWQNVAAASRGLIATEMLLGIAIAVGFETRKSLMASFGMLLFFSAFLAMQIVTGSGDENCGCFGELIPMNASQSLVKNLVFFAIGAVVWILASKRWFQWKVLFPVLGYGALIYLLFQSPYPEAITSEFQSTSIQPFAEASYNMGWQLDRDQHLVLVMYAKCIHCKQLANSLSAMGIGSTGDKLKVIIYGNEQKVDAFQEETDFRPNHLLKSDNRNVLAAINGTFPTVLLIDSSEVKSMWVGDDVNTTLFAQYFED